MDAQTSAANRVGRWGVLLAAIVLVGASAPGMRAGQQLTLADVERFVVGTWALAEWHENGKVLAPPTISGRWQLHDGQAMSIYHRDTDGIAWDQYRRWFIFGRVFRIQRIRPGGPTAGIAGSRSRVRRGARQPLSRHRHHIRGLRRAWTDRRWFSTTTMANVVSDFRRTSTSTSSADRFSGNGVG